MSTKENAAPWSIFKLIFKGENKLIQSMQFVSTDLKTAITKGKEYCTIYRSYFIRVIPVLEDIDALIAWKKGGKEVRLQTVPNSNVIHQDADTGDLITGDVQ